MPKSLGPEYASMDDVEFIPKYKAICFCGAVRYEVSADPVDAKICHCLACQKLHGAPMQWAAIFHKRHVRIIAGLDRLVFYCSERDRPERILPCKVSCGRCGTLIVDEGRRMWLACPSLFDFGDPTPHYISQSLLLANHGRTTILYQLVLSEKQLK